MKPLSSLLAVWLLQFGAAQAVVYVDGSSNTWKPMIGNYDYHVDQQTGQADGDIVGGTGINYGFLVAFNNNGNVSSIDGTIGFRVRLDEHGGNNSNPQPTNVLWVGIDANTDGKLDVFLGANFQGGGAGTLEIRAPGAGLNISPNTTTISNSAYKTYALDNIEDATPANFSYRAVNFLTDGGDTNDLTQTTTGDPDYYESFMIPFADLVAYLGSLSSPINITDTTPLRFVVATSTQVNSLNQDIGGLPKNFDGSQTWENLGGISTPYTPVPEPSSSVLLLGTLAGFSLVRRRR
jgi:hypothetical protein